MSTHLSLDALQVVDAAAGLGGVLGVALRNVVERAGDGVREDGVGLRRDQVRNEARRAKRVGSSVCEDEVIET